MSLYEVHSALKDDSHEGRVWIKDERLRSKIDRKRRVVRIRTKDGKKIYCEALYADENYFNRWRGKRTKFGAGNVIFINGWYRYKLDIQDIGKTKELDIALGNLWGKVYWYPRDHPQFMVLTTYMMGIIGLGLGVIGIGLGLVSLKELGAFLGLGVVVVGIIFAILGIRGIISR
jgi:hypothetical protein